MRTHTRSNKERWQGKEDKITWNENPRPFAWTKTADEILNSLAKYIEKISGAGH